MAPAPATPKNARVGIEYQLGLALAMDAGVDKYVDTRIALLIARQISDGDHAVKLRLLQSAAKENPYNVEVWYALAKASGADTAGVLSALDKLVGHRATPTATTPELAANMDLSKVKRKEKANAATNAATKDARRHRVGPARDDRRGAGRRVRGEVSPVVAQGLSTREVLHLEVTGCGPVPRTTATTLGQFYPERHPPVRPDPMKRARQLAAALLALGARGDQPGRNHRSRARPTSTPAGASSGRTSRTRSGRRSTTPPGRRCRCRHTWNNLDGQDGGNNYYRGPGWYRRHLDLRPHAADLAGRTLVLRFGAALPRGRRVRQRHQARRTPRLLRARSRSMSPGP